MDNNNNNNKFYFKNITFYNECINQTKLNTILKSLNNSALNNYNPTNIHFRNCTFLEKINVKNLNNFIKNIYFSENCVFDNLHFENCVFDNLHFENCNINELNIKKCKVEKLLYFNNCKKINNIKLDKCEFRNVVFNSSDSNNSLKIRYCNIKDKLEFINCGLSQLIISGDMKKNSINSFIIREEINFQQNDNDKNKTYIKGHLVIENISFNNIFLSNIYFKNVNKKKNANDKDAEVALYMNYLKIFNDIEIKNNQFNNRSLRLRKIIIEKRKKHTITLMNNKLLAKLTLNNILLQKTDMDNKIYIANTTIEEFEFSNSLFSCLYFANCDFEKKLEFLQSQITKLFFNNCNLEKINDFSFDKETAIEKLICINNQWGTIQDKRFFYNLFENNPDKARNLYRQFKHAHLRDNDNFNANQFYVLEMEAILKNLLTKYLNLRKNLLNKFLKHNDNNDDKNSSKDNHDDNIKNRKKINEFKSDVQEIALYSFYKTVSGFGKSYVRPIIWLFLITNALLFYIEFTKTESMPLVTLFYYITGQSALSQKEIIYFSLLACVVFYIVLIIYFLIKPFYNFYLPLVFSEIFLEFSTLFGIIPFYIINFKLLNPVYYCFLIILFSVKILHRYKIKKRHKNSQKNKEKLKKELYENLITINTFYFVFNIIVFCIITMVFVNNYNDMLSNYLLSNGYLSSLVKIIVPSKHPIIYAPLNYLYYLIESILIYNFLVAIKRTIR